MDQLIAIVMNSRQYRHVIGLPMAFDAAEQLLEEYWYILSPVHKRAVSKILLKSGKYTEVK